MKLEKKICCFTGHRKIPPGQIVKITRRLEKIITYLIKKGYSYFLVGGALGFDTIAAQAVLNLRERYSIELVLVLPCITQANGWLETDKQVYQDIKNKADKLIYTSQDYTKGCMFKRNRYLVDNSKVCICYLISDNGGTAYTVRYANSKKLTVFNVAVK